jgi:AcrR family transcriptional regulator
MAKPGSPRHEKTRTVLLESAARLFSAYGFRHTSMEAIAAEAKVAKTTVYAHFEDKEAAFAAAIAYSGRQMTERAAEAARAATTPEAAVLASLTSKSVEMFELLARSRHADEMLQALDGVGAVSVEAAHAHYVEALTQLVSRCERVGRKAAASLAVVLDHAAWGLVLRAGSAEELKRGLRLLTQRMVG